MYAECAYQARWRHMHLLDLGVVHQCCKAFVDSLQLSIPGLSIPSKIEEKDIIAKRQEIIDILAGRDFGEVFASLPSVEYPQVIIYTSIFSVREKQNTNLEGSMPTTGSVA